MNMAQNGNEHLVTDVGSSTSTSNQAGFPTSNKQNKPLATHYKPVQIFCSKPDGKGYILDHYALQRILGQPDVVNKPVAIYSVAGAFRKGKSFMLNLFLRFLQSGRSNDWLVNKKETLDRGFVARGGKERCTEGIWMWDEPFHVVTKHGEVIIFLMDTQGTFDYKSSMNSNLSIFALSTLISSVQIFNVMRQVEESDLQNLQLFTEYGSLTNKQSHKLQNEEHKSSPFQHLLFLVRDWCDPDYSYGLNGGREILKDFLKIREVNKDSKSVRESITTSFEILDCYLMPKPGDKVEVRGANSPAITIEDMSSIFLKEFEELVQYLFKDNVTPKRVNGLIITGKDLIYFASVYGALFESGEMPEAKPMMESTARAAMFTIYTTAKDSYIQNMNKLCTSTYIKPECLDLIHKECKQEILDHFDTIPKLGKKDLISEHRILLLSTMDQTFVMYEQSNNCIRETMKHDIICHIENARTSFLSSLEKKSGEKYVNEKRLKFIESESKEETLKTYRMWTETLDKGILSENEERLKNMFLQVHNSFLDKNLQRKDKMEMEVSSYSVKAKERYSNEMNKKCEGLFLEEKYFIVAHDGSFEIALEQFDSLVKTADVSMIEKHRSELEEELHELKEQFEKTNQINKELRDAKISKTISRAKECYNDLMKKICFSYKTIECIDQEHEKCKKKAMGIFDLAEKEEGKEFGNKCRTQLHDLVENALQNIKMQNEKIHKVNAINKFKENSNEAFDHYENYMLNVTEMYKDEDGLEKLNKEAELEAIQAYSTNITTEPSAEYDDIKSKLQKNISKRFESFKIQNANKKVQEEAFAQKQLEKFKSEYVVDMNKVCNETFVSFHDFKRKHEQLKSTLKEKLKECLQSKINDKILLDTSNRFIQVLEDEYESIKKNFLLKTGVKAGLGSVSGGVLGVAGMEAGAAIGAVGGPVGVVVGAGIGAVAGSVIGTVSGWFLGKKAT